MLSDGRAHDTTHDQSRLKSIAVDLNGRKTGHLQTACSARQCRWRKPVIKFVTLISIQLIFGWTRNFILSILAKINDGGKCENFHRNVNGYKWLAPLSVSTAFSRLTTSHRIDPLTIATAALTMKISETNSPLKSHAKSASVVYR